MSNKIYINQIQINLANLNNVINSVSNYLHQKNFKQITIKGETFSINTTDNQFNWGTMLKILF